MSMSPEASSDWIDTLLDPITTDTAPCTNKVAGNVEIEGYLVVHGAAYLNSLTYPGTIITPNADISEWF